MIRSLISSVKSAFLACYKSLQNIIFPPLCLACKQSCQTKWFCPTCWMQCATPDPRERCPHCFIESEGLCIRCKNKPVTSFIQGFVFEKSHLTPYLEQMEIETLASFAVLALHRLNWDFPDLIFPMPKSRAIAQKFSQMLNVAMTTDIDAIEENQTLLVFNVSATLEESMLTIATLKICSPKRGYLFHLYEL